MARKVKGLLPLRPIERYLRKRRNRALPSKETLRRIKVTAEDLVGEVIDMAARIAIRTKCRTVMWKHVQQAIAEFLTTTEGSE